MLKLFLSWIHSCSAPTFLCISLSLAIRPAMVSNVWSYKHALLRPRFFTYVFSFVILKAWFKMDQQGRINIRCNLDHKYLCHNAFWARGPSFYKISPESGTAVCALQQDEEVLKQPPWVQSVRKMEKMYDKACFNWALSLLELRRMGGRASRVMVLWHNHGIRGKPSCSC